MARERSGVSEVAQELLRRNGRIITIFTCLLIIAVGFTLVNDPGRWWVSLAAVALFFVVIFLFFNARVLIKSTVAIGLVLVESAWAFKIGAVSDYTGNGGSTWMLSTLVAFFTALAISYQMPSARSRWGVAALTTTASFFFVYSVAMGGLSLGWAAVIGAALNIAFFILIYRYGRRSSYKVNNMPPVDMDEETQKAITEGLRNYGWGAAPAKGRYKGGLLLWNERHAFVLSTMESKQRFGISAKGRRARGESYLTYEGNNVNPWLMDLVFQLVPFWRTRGANIMLVLLDRRNGNGTDAKVIGVEVPDTKARIPVGILPAQSYLDSRRYPQMAKRIEDEFNGYLHALTPRQIRALDSRLPVAAQGGDGDSTGE